MSTPPNVSAGRSRAFGPLCLAWGSEGPFSSFGSQWSPTFSKECLTALNAVRCAAAPSPYCSSALASVFA
jgi:hypothetical protein